MISTHSSMDKSLPRSTRRVDVSNSGNPPGTIHHLTRILVVELQRAFRAGALAERAHHDSGPIRALYHDDDRLTGD